EVTATEQDVSAFRALVNMHRPDHDLDLMSSKVCKDFWTDQSSIAVTWKVDGEEIVHLNYYGGCDPEKHRKMATDLWQAYRTLPALISLVEKPQTDDK
ncbi:hypothetical protein, partial [Altererythrobacter sp.]|uniref:hypothetical protein n=1 Tax=Altererythrobacter sp. TaxID=1872480 RepID=UPI003D098BE6